MQLCEIVRSQREQLLFICDQLRSKRFNGTVTEARVVNKTMELWLPKHNPGIANYKVSLQVGKRLDDQCDYFAIKLVCNFGLTKLFWVRKEINLSIIIEY